MKNFTQKGDVLDYQNDGGSTIVSGSIVVIGSLLAVAVVDIAAGATGAVLVDGVVELPKASATVVTAGQSLDYAAASGVIDKITTPAAGDLTSCCVAVAAAAGGETSVTVLLNLRGGTVN